MARGTKHFRQGTVAGSFPLVETASNHGRLVRVGRCFGSILSWIREDAHGGTGDALAEVIGLQNDEILLHEEREDAITEEVELFSARLDELEKENASLRRKQIMVGVGLVAVIIGGALGLWAFAL